jgi:hypothetical protein
VRAVALLWKSVPEDFLKTMCLQLTPNWLFHSAICPPVVPSTPVTGDRSSPSALLKGPGQPGRDIPDGPDTKRQRWDGKHTNSTFRRIHGLFTKTLMRDPAARCGSGRMFRRAGFPVHPIVRIERPRSRHPFGVVSVSTLACTIDHSGSTRLSPAMSGRSTWPDRGRPRVSLFSGHDATI